MLKNKNQTVLINDKNLKLDNGILNYKEQPFSGVLISYFKNNQLKTKIEYKKGKKEGVEKHWNINGFLVEERYFLNGRKSGIHKGWWGINKLKFIYTFNDIGMYHGNVKEWYSNGQLYRDFNFNNGKEVGSQKLWKLDGTIKANYEVVKGERFGLIGLKKCYQVSVGSDEIN